MTHETSSTAVTVVSGVSTTVVGVFDLSDLGIIVGIVCTVLSFVVSLYYHRKRDRRESLQQSRMWHDRAGRKMLETSFGPKTDSTTRRKT